MDGERADQEAAAPAQGGRERCLTRAGSFEPSAEQGSGDAEENNADLEGYDGCRIGQLQLVVVNIERKPMPLQGRDILVGDAFASGFQNTLRA